MFQEEKHTGIKSDSDHSVYLGLFSKVPIHDISSEFANMQCYKRAVPTGLQHRSEVTVGEGDQQHSDARKREWTWKFGAKY